MYQPAGHIITGNFDIIKDARLRKLLSKGPKYRLPNTLDFNSSRIKIAEALHNFSTKWCKRENVEQNALSEWIKQIFKIIDTRIKFYSSRPDLLPPKPRLSFRYLKGKLKDFHSKYVFVPADKAANNIIII